MLQNRNRNRKITQARRKIVLTCRGNVITRSRVLFRVRSSLVATERSFTFTIAGRRLESVPDLYGRHIVSAEILEYQVQTRECLLESSRNFRQSPNEYKMALFLITGVYH